MASLGPKAPEGRTIKSSKQKPKAQDELPEELWDCRGGLPGLFGVAGYAASLVVITFGYAMFQAVNLTAVMQETTNEHRGVTSALVGLSLNVGLMVGASAMGAVYAMGPKNAEWLGLGADQASGLAVTFALAACLAAVSLGAVLWGRLEHTHPKT